MPTPLTHVYEVVEATCEEQYHTLGMFLDEQEALSMLDGDSPPYHDCNPDSVTVEVRKRPVGFHPHDFAMIAKRTWVRNYDDLDFGDWRPGQIETRFARP